MFNRWGVMPRMGRCGRDERVIKPVLLEMDVAVGCR